MCYNYDGDGMRIDKIIKLKNNKYKMIIDGEELVTFDNVLLDNNLLYNKNIDNDLYKKIKNDTTYYEVYNDTVKYILKKKRSKKEIIDFLDKKHFDKKDTIIKKLEDLKLINDIEYCASYINDKIYLSKNGINKIRIDLLNQNIPIDVIENELNKIDYSVLNDRLEKMIIKKIKYNRKYSNYQLSQKIMNEMVNLGYNKEQVIDILNQNLIVNDSIINNEFNKIYSKFKNRLSGVELNNKIKQKMLSKGFELEKINELIKKTEN